MAETTLTQTAPAQSSAEPTRQAPLFQPRFDITETENELTLFGDLPGVDQGDLDIRYENEQLIVQGRVAARNEGLQVLRQEYGVGDFQRTFTIGEAIDAEAINAEVHNGVLVVHLPKAEAAKPKRIAVKAV
ncbi:Hsp20/alpha crystallin family protein [Rubripirellula reticaptiva]|uniref:Spore protein SP21 n=1 Tax=Rubripirellula reticaptiva TaxID=2528013 RepID=A0A5C6ECN9_9BACT|nr:Hsp20/alpha crystallin family protein [Rubripirellula reticaptiva]TWU46678.1 Spore protein SP21 [Rubripirellula reticaptiva]